MHTHDVATSESLGRLVNTLNLAAGAEEFTLYFVQCGLQRQQDEYIEHLTGECAKSGVTILRLDLRQQILEDLQREALDLVRQRFPDGPPPSLSLAVTGLESSILLDNDEDHPAVLQVLNLARERFPATLPFPFTIWLSEAMLRKVQSAAPDFWSWRAAEPERLALDARLDQEEVSAALKLERIQSWSDAVGRVGRLEYLLAVPETSPADKRNRAELAWRLGDAYRFLERYDKAQRAYLAALNPAWPDMQARVLNKLGIVLRETGDLDTAEQWLDDFLAQTRSDPTSQAVAMNNLGLVYLDRGELERAEQALTTARDLAAKAQHVETGAFALANLGLVYLRQQRAEEARRQFEDALRISRSLGDPRGYARDLMNLGLANSMLGQESEALRLFMQAVEVSDSALDLVEAKRCRVQLAKQLVQAGGDATPWYTQALEYARRLRDDRDELNILMALARVYETRGAEYAQQSTSLYEEALRKTNELGDWPRQLACIAALIRASGRNDPDLTARLKAQARRLLTAHTTLEPLTLQAWVCDESGMLAAPPGHLEVGRRYLLCVCEGRTDPPQATDALVTWEIVPELVLASRATLQSEDVRQGIGRYAEASPPGRSERPSSVSGAGTIPTPPTVVAPGAGPTSGGVSVGGPSPSSGVSTPRLQRVASRAETLHLEAALTGVHCDVDEDSHPFAAPAVRDTDLVRIAFTPTESGQVWLDIRCQSEAIPFDARLTLLADPFVSPDQGVLPGPGVVLVLAQQPPQLEVLDDLRQLGVIGLVHGTGDSVEGLEQLLRMTGLLRMIVTDLVSPPADLQRVLAVSAEPRYYYQGSADLLAYARDRLRQTGDVPPATGETIVFNDTSTAIGPDLRTRLLDTLVSYQEYFVRLGFEPPAPELTVDVLQQTPGGTYGYYDPGPHRIVILASVAEDADVLLRQYGHHVLFAHGPLDVYAEASQALLAIESGLTTYFCCSFNDDPVFAGLALRLNGASPTNWSLDNHRSFGEIGGSAGSTMEDGIVWGGAFWEMRQLLGQAKTDALLFGAWLDTDRKFVDDAGGLGFAQLVWSRGETLLAEGDVIRAVFARRGLQQSNPA
jgi:tetratricopeptide (TPR) repeat protein